MWYFNDIARFKSEREAIYALENKAEWCAIVGMQFDSKLRLTFDIDISVGQRSYRGQLRYPALFPHTPPIFLPREKEPRWSSHQYGVEGELCLEYRPDNWTSDLTGKDIIESAHRLLSGENPANGEINEVPSQHFTTLGQSLRNKALRLIVTRNLAAALNEINPAEVVSCKLVPCYRSSANVFSISKLQTPDGSEWNDTSHPTVLVDETFETSGSIVRIAKDEYLPQLEAKAFRQYCASLGLSADVSYVVILQGSEVRAYWQAGENDAWQMSIVPPEEPLQRLDADHGGLKDKSVALIGCGSLGSKIGVMLARSGVGRFVILDDDVLLPGNLVRNDLDWRDIGTHKSEAVARRMQLVSPTVKTRTRQIQLTGQESSGSAETALNTVAGCDLIIDATANPDAFNLIAAVASSAKKAVVWAEVFAGGIGGLIARSRAGIEPSPQLARRSIENWFAEKDASPPHAGRGYETDEPSGPMIADDADVSAIAAAGARLAIDTLIGRSPSTFPYSAYAIGLAEGSVFQQPFQTWPIDLGAPPPEEEKALLTEEEIKVELDAILSAIPKT